MSGELLNLIYHLSICLNPSSIPLGYWSVPMNDSVSVAPYTPGAWPYFLRALNWAKTNALNTIVDLHGAPGSQNGYDNSGQRTDNPTWATDQANVNRTLEILSTIADLTGGMIDVLDLLNEVAGFIDSQWANVARQFWQDGYTAVRDAAGGEFKVMIGDAFLGVDAWEDFLQLPSAQGVMMDEVTTYWLFFRTERSSAYNSSQHVYQIFSNPELERTDDEHISVRFFVEYCRSGCI